MGSFPVRRTTRRGVERRCVLFTVGYERRSVEEMVEALRDAGVRVLLDVRELPLSRRRGFSKTRLSQAVHDAGLGYEHVRSLGNPKPLRQLYMAGELQRGADAYGRHLRSTSRDALLELASRADEGICLLCVEHDHERCHRAVIVDALREVRGDLAVTHL